MRTHVEYNPLMRTVEIYVEERPGWWLSVNSSDSVKRVEVAEGTQPPAFLILTADIWQAITEQVPNKSEDFTRTLLKREQDRVDKLIDNLLD